jgi:hypothetical protein
MVKKFLDHKVWVILAAAIAIMALILLAAGLENMRFQPGVPLSRGETTAIQVSLEKTLNEIANIPLWKQVVFWILVLLLIIIIAAMFSPEMRKRLIRYFLRLALFTLALFYIVKNYRSLFPRLNLASGLLAESGPATGLGSTQEVFTPPHLSSGLLYLISLGSILLLGGLAFLARRWWMKVQSVRSNSHPLVDLAEIVRDSLDDISSGRDWEAVIIKCYTRMNNVVGARRGVQRRKDTTPGEFSIRLEQAGLPGEAVHRLTHLFEEARYGARQANQMEVNEAIACLDSVLTACGVEK